jgi:hypothetical protein
MFEDEIKSKLAETDLGEAILASLQSEMLYTDNGGCTVGGLEDRFDDRPEGVWPTVLKLIAERKAYLAAPLSLVEDDTYVLPVRWEIGQTHRLVIETIFGNPHGVSVAVGGETLTYDIYVENVDDPTTYPLPPASYRMREAADPRRPKDCPFPYTGTWPPEAMQITFEFDKAGILVGYSFGVGVRLT